MKEDWQIVAIVEAGDSTQQFIILSSLLLCLKVSKVKCFWKWEIKISLFELKENSTMEQCCDPHSVLDLPLPKKGP